MDLSFFSSCSWRRLVTILQLIAIITHNNSSFAMEVSKSWKFEQQELCNFILSLRIAVAATMTTLRMEFLHKHLAAEIAAAVQEIALSLSLSHSLFIQLHSWVLMGTYYLLLFFDRVVGTRVHPKVQTFWCFSCNQPPWLTHDQKNSETLGATSGRSLHSWNRIEVFSLCNTKGKII